MSNNLYYIYIDTKILGAIKQLLGYFDSGVFNSDACIAVYVKYYKENNEIISKIFDENGIPYKFIKKYSDITFEDEKVVFYLFNAQSNCRMVAFRNVSHVFITHGESNKKSSVKPIIRIYDHVITSGQVGIDRYLKAGLFTKFDIEENRVIRLGNTFIGQNNYHYDKDSRTLLYAPTWEGGVLDENFSSISKDIDKFLLKLIESYKIKNLIVQNHPNLGHRDKCYKQYLKLALSKIIKQGVKVSIIKNNASVKENIYALYNGFKYTSSKKNINISYAVTDISAMEIQLLVKNVPTIVLANSHVYNELIIPNKMANYYSDTVLFLNKKSSSVCFQSPKSIKFYVESYHEKTLKYLSFDKRIEWLCGYINENKVLQSELTQNI
ncbi:hypothetical protein [Psychrobacter alimentarius]|uniref:hypothetical protein n=1 Tax=Psychrobacter alimentarius TaxID=261164 RepID=UPI003FD1564C